MRVRAQEVVVQQLMGSRLHHVHLRRLNVLDHVVRLDAFDNICLEPIMTLPTSGRTMKHFLQDGNPMSKFLILTNSILRAILLLSANNNLKRVLPHTIDIHRATPPLPFPSPSPDLHIRSLLPLCPCLRLPTLQPFHIDDQCRFIIHFQVLGRSLVLNPVLFLRSLHLHHYRQ